MITQHRVPVLIAPGHGVPSFAIMGHMASVCMRIRVYSKTLVLGPTTRNARAGSQSTTPPVLTGPRNHRSHGPRWADRNSDYPLLIGCPTLTTMKADLDFNDLRLSATLNDTRCILPLHRSGNHLYMGHAPRAFVLHPVDP
jgi:hypothetical protein